MGGRGRVPRNSRPLPTSAASPAAKLPSGWEWKCPRADAANRGKPLRWESCLMPLCLIGLGSNLGDREGLLNKALVRLQRHADIILLRQSRYHETLPVGGPAQSAYLNAAAVLQTSLSPQALLAELQRAETDLGRQRFETWGPRTVDLDL